MSYLVQYRGGPRAGKKEALPSLPNEMPVVRYTPNTNVRLVWDSNPNDVVGIDNTQYGVYSRVFTPQKNGSYLYVWIKK